MSDAGKPSGGRPPPAGARPSGPHPRPAGASSPSLPPSAARPSGQRPALGAAPARPSSPGTPAPARPSAAAPSLASAPPRPSGVLSAARAQPAPVQGDLKQKLKAGAEDTALNVVGALKDSVRDFSRASIYFKYKVLIAGLWAVLMSGTFFVACPQNPLSVSNDLGARLVMAGEADRPVFMVKNESDTAWKDVVLVVDKQYRAATAGVAPGSNFTVTPKLLVGPGNQLAPSDLRPRHLELRTADGSEILLENGAPP